MMSKRDLSEDLDLRPEGMEWDYAEDSGDIELFNFN